MYVSVQIICLILLTDLSQNVDKCSRQSNGPSILVKWNCPEYPLQSWCWTASSALFCAVSVLSSLICSPVLHCQCCICSSPLVHFLSLLLHPLPHLLHHLSPLLHSPALSYLPSYRQGQSKHEEVTSPSYFIRSLLFLGQRAALLIHPINEESLGKWLCHVTFRR